MSNDASAQGSTPRADTPDMSVLVLTADRFKRIRKSVRAIRAQDVCDRLELIILAPSVAELGLEDSEVQGFWDCRVVETGPVRLTGEARALGVLQARAPIVVTVEDHAFPHEGWARTILEAFEGPWAGVGGTMHNANPETLSSCLDMVMNFGPGVMRNEGAESKCIIWHHSAFRRELLLEYGQSLAMMLEVEGLLQEDLLRRGKRLYQSAAAISHVNISQYANSFRANAGGGRMYWSARADVQRWSPLRRLAVALATPGLIPIRFLRACREMVRLRLFRELTLGWPILLACSTVVALGAAQGMLFGAGRVYDDRIRVELDRRSLILPEEAARLFT